MSVSAGGSVCLFVNPLDNRCIKLSWQLGLSWFFLVQHVNDCSLLRICVYGRVEEHKTEGARGSMCAGHLLEPVCRLVCVCVNAFLLPL